MNSRFVLTSILLLLFSTSCRKNEIEPDYHGKIQNNAGQAVTVDLYTSQGDYNMRTNVAYSFLIEPGNNYLLPTELETGAKLFIDYYSTDFGYTNWGADPTFNVSNISPELDPALTINPNFTLVRKIFLNGNDVATKWKAVDAKSGSTSRWDVLTENQRWRQLVFNRDLTGTYSYKDENGVVQHLPFTFRSFITGSTTPSILVSFADNVGSGSNQVSAATMNGIVSENTIQTQSNFPPTNSGTFYAFYYDRQ